MGHAFYPIARLFFLGPGAWGCLSCSGCSPARFSAAGLRFQETLGCATFLIEAVLPVFRYVPLDPLERLVSRALSAFVLLLVGLPTPPFASLSLGFLLPFSAPTVGFCLVALPV